ncbi:Tex family protein [Taibaiella soli]|uniref:RNA-binding transcriptional accessory protein n=1 Tax=Taibaiella soli TaxID=1649169 RepID=A0A2W2BZG8_9BACT|nr:Tex family protein [Taibaiella soli]PZF73243.1 RNA-binding transcriptional accessory protein [Taibaiella soli]
MQEYAAGVAARLNIAEKQVATVLELLAEGATIPFIARYRKDRTGALDEVQIQNIQDEGKFLKEFSERKIFIEKTITEQGKMTEALQKKLDAAITINELEDIYLPYKPKRKTKAQTARENGLEPLALLLLEQGNIAPLTEAGTFITENVKSPEEALQGARDIIAEMVNEDAQVRAKMRKLFESTATMQSKVLADKEAEGVKYKDYYEFSEPVGKIPSHRILAVMRGFMEGVLRMVIAPEEEEALLMTEKMFVKANNEAADHVKKAVKDAYRRLLQPSLESEFRMALKTKADEEAINVFAENLRQLLLSSPLGGKRTLALDPGYRTGCKVVCLDEKGELKKTDLIYVHENNFRLTEAEQKIRALVKEYKIEAFAVGDGTAGRETEQFVKKLDLGLPVFLVNEDGASVYSASETAREEFPDQDVTVRGAVSIGRRLMDPLAELVKIDPKSIGVGQYQHDVNQVRLKERLDQTVISCVNAVGVNLNTASKHLLGYVSGIGPSLADNIVKYRSEIGSFTTRKQLMQVPRLGSKAFEQCAGFLRVKNGDNPLDASAVHPEAYNVVLAMAKDLGVDVAKMIGNDQLVNSIPANKYVTETIGAHTIQDILKELKKPGLDPRSEAQAFEFAGIYKIEDVHVGMIVPGIVTNLTRFGAFVDIGVKQDGLVHVSEISHNYITDPNEALKLNDKVTVKVLEVDVARKRISLSIKQTLEVPARRDRPKGMGSGGNKNEHKEEKDMLGMNMNDALSLLKKKFGK